VILVEEEPVPKSDQRLKQAQTASWLQSTPVPSPPPKPDQCTLAEEVVAHVEEMRISNFQRQIFLLLS